MKWGLIVVLLLQICQGSRNWVLSKGWYILWHDQFLMILRWVFISWHLGIIYLVRFSMSHCCFKWLSPLSYLSFNSANYWHQRIIDFTDFVMLLVRDTVNRLERPRMFSIWCLFRKNYLWLHRDKWIARTCICDQFTSNSKIFWQRLEMN